MASPRRTPPTGAVSPSQYSEPSPERNPNRRSLMDFVGNLLRENQGRADIENNPGHSPETSLTDSPSQYSQPSNRATARRSLLGLVGHLLREEGHSAAAAPERRTIVEENPPRLPSLDLPRPRPSFQTMRSPTFMDEAPLPAIPPPSSSRRASASSHRLSSGSRRSSIGSMRSSTGSTRSASRRTNPPPPPPPPARVLSYGDPPPFAPVPEAEAVHAWPDRHPADPMPERHPADPLPERSFSESASSSSGASTSSGGGPPRHQQKKKKRRTRRGGGGPRWIPRRSEGRIWFPALRYRAVRNKFFHVVITGTLVLLVLVIFLALMNTTNDFAQEFRIITILFILIFAVLFVHSLLRFSVLVVRVRRDGSLGEPGENDDASFARVREPIRVVLARDEELGLGAGETPEPAAEVIDPAKAIRPPPPTYGKWRDSVRVDPNLIHWERNENIDRRLSEGTIRRPPSYISERDEPLEEPQSRDTQPWNEKPIRARTPEPEPEPELEPEQQPMGQAGAATAQRTSVLYTRINPRQSWMPQLPAERSQMQRLNSMG